MSQISDNFIQKDKTMPALTQQDLRIFASQRLSDTDDGGGKMTTHVLTGADNELFNPVSNLDRAMGGFDARLVYPAVLADETLLGSHTIVSAPPAAANTAVLLVKGDYYGQERASIMERIESYRAATVESRMSLVGKQRKGAKQIQTYQATTAVAPSIGDVFALRR